MKLARLLLPLFAVLSLTPIAPAQAGFAVTMNEAEVEPFPTASPAIGRGWFSLDPATDALFYRVESDVVAPVGAALFIGPSGAVPAFLLALVAAGPGMWQGTTPALGAALRAELYQGNFCVQVLSAAFPAGEIRGQILKTRCRTGTTALTGPGAATISPGSGTAGTVSLLPERRVIYRLTAAGLMGAATVAHIHDAAGGVILTLTGDPAAGLWSGVSPQLSIAQITAITNGTAAIDVHSVPFPAGLGEIRGPVVPQVETFFAKMSGGEAVPPNANPGTGLAKFSYDPAVGVLTYNAAWTGFGAIGAHLRLGAPGTSGGDVLFLGAGNGPWLGGAAIGGSTAADLFFGRLYVEVDFPGAPIRGQLRMNPDTYGWGGPTIEGSLGRVLRILSIGPPTLGNPAFGVGVQGAAPGVTLSLAYGVSLAGTPLDLAFVAMPGHVLWHSPVAGVGAIADPLGAGSVSFAIPALAALIGVDYYLQWFASEPGMPGTDLVTSNGLHVTLQP